MIDYNRVRRLVGEQLLWAARNLEDRAAYETNQDERDSLMAAVAALNHLGQWVDVTLAGPTGAGAMAIHVIRTWLRGHEYELTEESRAGVTQAISALGAPIGMTTLTGGR